MPPTLGTNVLGRKVLYLPSFFTYAKYIVQVDGKIGLFRGLSPRLMSNALSTVTRGSMKKVFPPDEIEQVSNKDDMKTSLKKVVKETSYEMMMQCVSRMLAHPLHEASLDVGEGGTCTHTVFPAGLVPSLLLGGASQVASPFEKAGGAWWDVCWPGLRLPPSSATCSFFLYFSCIAAIQERPADILATVDTSAQASSMEGQMAFPRLVQGSHFKALGSSYPEVTPSAHHPFPAVPVSVPGEGFIPESDPRERGRRGLQVPCPWGVLVSSILTTV
ncbi:Hypothetical predicted protein [Marmota monax]|uniref:Uncharacterized protein n=2 Tax=Marmota monax TaxID=9995 RepID=A0A5E4B9W5_MARMO|nr:hypothetical protein GHT09_000698 [Marmota monax]VTJ66537.1 Hypothetical predicted protein [Marmota monax]